MSLQQIPDRGFARDLSLGYNRTIGHERLVATKLYITLIYKKRERISKKARSINAISREFEQRLEEFSNVAAQFERSLSRFNPVPLREYEVDGVIYSEQLSFYNFLITGRCKKFAYLMALYMRH